MQLAAAESDFAGLLLFDPVEGWNEEGLLDGFFSNGVSVFRSFDTGSAVHSRQLRQGSRAGQAGKSADLRRSLGSMVIDVSPDARPIGPCRPRQVRRTVCLA